MFFVLWRAYTCLGRLLATAFAPQLQPLFERDCNCCGTTAWILLTQKLDQLCVEPWASIGMTCADCDQNLHPHLRAGRLWFVRNRPLPFPNSHSSVCRFGHQKCANWTAN